jgi:hypothetical protein
MTKHTLTARIALLLALAALAPLAAQSGGGTASFSKEYVPAHFTGVSINEYGSLVGATRLIRSTSASIEEKQLYGNLDGDSLINTASELLAMASVLGIQDVKKEDALKLYAEIAMEGAANSFLGVTGTTHSQVLERLRGKYNFTQAEITDAIRATVAATVIEEFSKVSFPIEVRGKAFYDAELAFNPKTGEYILSYDGNLAVENDDKKLSASSLDALLSAISRSPDFNQSSAGLVHEKFAQIPMVSQIGQKTVESTVLITEILTGFYTAQFPSDKERYYKALLGMHRRYFSLNVRTPAISSLLQTVKLLSPVLADKFEGDCRGIKAINPRQDNSDDIDALAGLISLQY